MKVIKRTIHRSKGAIQDTHLLLMIPTQLIEIPGDYHLLGQEWYIQGTSEPIADYNDSTSLEMGIGYENLLQF